MHYFIAIELPNKGKDTAYGVVVPDIPGCFSAGDTLEEAIANATEAIVMQLEDMIERKLDLPEPSPPEELARAKEFKGWMFVGVDVDPQQLSTKAKRINITIPEGVLYMVDRAAAKSHTTRSAFLTDAVTTYMIKDSKGRTVYTGVTKRGRVEGHENLAITKRSNAMAGKKSGTFNKGGIENLAKDKPVVYNIENKQGKTLYTGVAKRGRVVDRLKEHLPSGPDPVRGGAKVRIQQKLTIAEAIKAEARSIKRNQPPQNKRGK